MSKDNTLTTRQQVWLAAWTAALQSGKYNPPHEAEYCLREFDNVFGDAKPRVVLNEKTLRGDFSEVSKKMKEIVAEKETGESLQKD